MKTEDVRKKVKFDGTISANFYEVESAKRVIYVDVDGKTADFIESLITSAGMVWDGESMPIKQREDGTVYVKMSSKFSTHTPGYDIKEIGKGSVVTAYCVIKPGAYKRKRYVSAFLSGLDVKTFEPLIEYNPFEDEEYEETPDEVTDR